jgi:hypothetical protein
VETLNPTIPLASRSFSARTSERSAIVDRAVRRCYEQFGEVAAAAADPIETRSFGALSQLWRRYYYNGGFADLDRLLLAESGTGRVDHLIPLSICHHNLHRLFAVLALELHEHSLVGDLSVPERVMDLGAMIHRLDGTLERAASSSSDSPRPRKED